MNRDWQNRYETAVRLAQKAGRHAQTYFDRGIGVEWKDDRSPVTIADREAEAILRKELLDAFPADGFLGEESGDHHGSSGYRWIIDPIDGTRSFVRNIPIWATLVGLECRGEMIAGVAYLPAMGGVCYRAMRGDGCWRDDRKLHVSHVESLPEAVMFYSSLSWFVKAGKRDEFLQLAGLTQRQRGFGDFYGFVLVAQGSGEIMAEHGVKPWDIAGLSVLVEEAGGMFTDWSGNRDINSPDVLATNGKMHDQCLRILNGSVK
jgi:histidinol-phosphatase